MRSTTETVSASSGITDTNWHVYGLAWSDTAHDFYVDGSLTWHFTTAISQTSGIAYVDYVRYWTSR
jgi:hypothetical protein